MHQAEGANAKLGGQSWWWRWTENEIPSIEDSLHDPREPVWLQGLQSIEIPFLFLS